MSIAQTVWQLLNHLFLLCKAKRVACLSLFGEGWKNILFCNQKHCHKWDYIPEIRSLPQKVWQLLKYLFLLYEARRGASPPFWGGVEKCFVQHSKAFSKMGLNLENHVYSSYSMAITKISILTL